MLLGKHIVAIGDETIIDDGLRLYGNQINQSKAKPVVP